ncbi:MAG: inorganic pyrophosphatase [Candidatus Hydrogenedentes bacterium]|nr:inorganic pyrophosphatase [Candidatus Hydrogenedentota bacterium]
MEKSSGRFDVPIGQLFRAHPWHGVSIGKDAPAVVTSFIEMVPTDTVKYELDKLTGILRVDRPQRFSNVCPALYGMIPQTYCADRVASLCTRRTGRSDIVGDEDPLDICVLTEKHIGHGNVLVEAIPIGGLRLIDGNEADDKIIAVLLGDTTYGECKDISQCQPGLVERLKHYFLTYKQSPDVDKRVCELAGVYGREDAIEVIRQSREDYRIAFPDFEQMLSDIERKR